MSKNEELIVSAAVLRDGKKKLSCAQAIKISQDRNISLKEIGEICNSNSIKIIECELGCFK
ncbi:MAG: hypothetical protein V1874_01850 [Spirochaetota bacterium]